MSVLSGVLLFLSACIVAAQRADDAGRDPGSYIHTYVRSRFVYPLQEAYSLVHCI